MTEVPKIVHDRLRAALPERAHPDADLLTAFAEQTLSATEREGVLEHLALCGDCREVIALALPAAASAATSAATPIATGTEAVRATPIPMKAERNWLTLPKFAGRNLRWAALAAGVAVVASVLLVHPGKLNQATLPSINPQIATTAPPASAPQIASSPMAPSPMDQSTVSAKTDEARSKPESRSSKKLKAGEIVTPSHQAESGMLLAGNRKDSVQADRLSAAPPAGTRAFTFNAPASQGATGTVTETVEVTGAAPAVEVAPSAAGSLIAQNETPAIEKAKPALQGVEVQGVEVNEQPATKAAVPGLARSQAVGMTAAAKLAAPVSSTFAPNVIWSLAAGVLQRSLDGSQSWQSALRADRPLLCYATNHGADVWTGGQAGTLFHSADSGVTWVQVRPSIKGQQLSSDVTHIELRGPLEIVVSTSTNEIWSSADGGKTWEKK